MLKKILMPVVLAVIGLLLLVGALVLYPAQDESPAPPYATLYLHTTFPVSNIYYAVRQVSPSIAEIGIGVALAAGTLRPLTSAPAAQLLVSPPFGTNFSTCPSRFCHIGGSPNQPIEIWLATLGFKTERDQFASYGEAFVNLYIKTHSFGESFNGVTAAVAIPAVACINCGNPVLHALYNIPAANSYDWSSSPTQFVNGTYAAWNEAVIGVTTGRAAVGINHANQSKDNDKTFFAGALLGLAGAALLSAVQEALHAND